MKKIFLFAGLCFAFATSHAQQRFSMGALVNNYAQARDLNVVDGSSNPDTATSSSMSLWSISTIVGWNNFVTSNGPAGVEYAVGFTISNPVSTSNGNSSYAAQYASATDAGESIYYRSNPNIWRGSTSAYNGWGPWVKIWHSGDDGAGSGLDADLIRGAAPQWTTNASNGYVYTTNATGYVGIGTSSPQSLLAVAGVVTAKGVTVTTTGWPDFVFAQGYALPSLDSVAAYTQRYSHLPGVPSASDVARDGQDLGAMNKVLLQKVEELTRYAIEAERHARAQDSVIAELQAQVGGLSRKH